MAKELKDIMLTDIDVNMVEETNRWFADLSSLFPGNRYLEFTIEVLEQIFKNSEKSPSISMKESMSEFMTKFEDIIDSRVKEIKSDISNIKYKESID